MVLLVGYVGVVLLFIWCISQLVGCMVVGLVWFLPGDLLLSLPCLLLHLPGVDPDDVGCVQVGRVGVGNRCWCGCWCWCRCFLLVLVLVTVCGLVC